MINITMTTLFKCYHLLINANIKYPSFTYFCIALNNKCYTKLLTLKRSKIIDTPIEIQYFVKRSIYYTILYEFNIIYYKIAFIHKHNIDGRESYVF